MILHTEGQTFNAINKNDSWIKSGYFEVQLTDHQQSQGLKTLKTGLLHYMCF